MKTYEVTYEGNTTRFINFYQTRLAYSEREAVEDVYRKILKNNYFPQDDGTILDSEGNEIAMPKDNIIIYDEGYFYAKEIDD